MKVKVFDESHEKDLENSVNSFLKEIDELLDIIYSWYFICFKCF